MAWSELPSDLLHLISRRLHDPIDFLHFRAVCRGWRAAASLSSPPPFLPWLLSLPDPSDPSFLSLATPTHYPDVFLPFFSLSSGKVRCIRAAGAAGMELVGPSHGHLLFADNHRKTLLINPLTGTQILLPPGPFTSDSVYGYIPNHLSGGASDSIVLLYSTNKLSLYQPGTTSCWTEVPVRDFVAENMYHKGKIFVSSACGDVTVLDSATLAEVAVVPPPTLSRDAFKCFVPSSDDLLCVVRQFRREGDILEDCGFEVHRLDFAKESPQWVVMRSIGYRMLFVGLYQGFSFRAGDFTGFEGNCIYFFKLERAKRSYIYRFNLEDGCIKELPGPWMHGGTWFVPSLS